MARTHGKILCTIWHDPDFLARTEPAQRLYLVILSQPKLNLVGLLDYFPGRLARLSATSSLAAVEDAIAELEEYRFVLVDRQTDELLVRSFTKNDPIQMANSKLRKGIWSAWQAIDSPTLREAAVRQMPAALFDHPEVPPRAVDIRRSERIEPPNDSPTDRPIDEARIDRPIEGRTDTPPPPPPPPPPPAASTARPSPTDPVDNSKATVGAHTTEGGLRVLNGTGAIEPYQPTDPITPDERQAGLAVARSIPRLTRATPDQDQPE